MSLDFTIAPYCKSKRCTNLLLSSSEYRAGYCYLCACELGDQMDKDKEEEKAREDKEKEKIKENK